MNKEARLCGKCILRFNTLKFKQTGKEKLNNVLQHSLLGVVHEVTKKPPQSQMEEGCLARLEQTEVQGKGVNACA